MATIAAYTPRVYELEAEHLTLPFADPGFQSVCVLLDGITHACEQGRLDDEKWVEQCFASREVFDIFIGRLSEYDECFRIADRWYATLMRLAGAEDEEGFVASADIADRLMEQAHETGQL